MQKDAFATTKPIDDVLALAGRVDRAADVRAASVLIGEPTSGSAQVYELRLIATDLRRIADLLAKGAP